MGVAGYEQYFRGLEPCHLCVLQRIAVVALGLGFGLAALVRPGRGGRRWVAGWVAFWGLAGLAVALRQVWIQAQPPGSVPSCGADLATLLAMLPLQEVFWRILRGGGDCQAVTWQFLGLSMAGWVAVWLAALTAAGLWINARGSERP